MAAAQLDGVVNAEVETKSAERIVDVRGVAGQEHAALAKRHGHPLVHMPSKNGTQDRRWVALVESVNKMP